MEQIIEKSIKTNQSKNVEQPKKTMFNRTDRRWVKKMAGLFSKKSKRFNLDKWREEIIENIKSGYSLQDKKEKSINESIEKYITTKQDSIVKSWKELGYSKAKIEQAKNDWIDRVISRKNWLKNNKSND